MIDDNTIIKYERARGHKFDWPEAVINLKERLKEMKLGFPGIGNDHLSLTVFNNIVVNDIFIIDNFLESNIRGDEAPLMLKSVGNGNYYIMGIGCGVDSVRDPDRLRFRYGDIVYLPTINPNTLVCRVDVRPTLCGGPGYYYFFKSYRDFRL